MRKVCRRPETAYKRQILHAARVAASPYVQTPPKEAVVESALIDDSPAEQKPLKQHKMMDDVNTDKATMISIPDQEELMVKTVAALPAAPPEIRNDSCSDVPMGCGGCSES